MSLSNDGSPPADQSAPAAPASPPPADESVNLEALNQEPSDAAPLDGEVLEPAEDLDDLEYEPGKKYRVPKPVKDGWLRQADYTRKTQEVAEHRKALEAERQAFGQTAASVQQHIEAVADLRVVDRTLKEYENVDWERAWRENPVEAGAAQSRLAALERQRQTLVGTIQQGEQARALGAKRETAKRLEETRQSAQKIKGWSPQLDAEICQVARDIGFTDAELESALSPRVYRLMHLAWLGSRKSAPQPSASPAQPPAEAIAPLTTVSRAGSNPPRKWNLTDKGIPQAEYERLRKAQGAR
jgi:hypothetical protein